MTWDVLVSIVSRYALFQKFGDVYELCMRYRLAYCRLRERWL